MATIGASNTAKIYQIKKWLGLNESPDGDTGMKMGEAAVMRNFRITRENHLQVRPGYAPICTLAEAGEDGTKHPVRGMWYGYVAGVRHFLCSCAGHIWDVDMTTWAKTDCGSVPDTAVTFFGFAQKVYILTGSEYYSWSGEGSVHVVEGYVPIVATASQPTGGGTLLQSVNKLTGKRRQQFSPDGTATKFSLIETNVDEIVSVEGTDITYTADLEKGEITFASAPEKGVNTVVITWRKGNGDRGKITGMKFAEFFNGASDSRVFLYGDGTNETIYSGLDANGSATAEYFPDLNVMAIDSANTPITALIRHYDRLLVFKADSAHSVQYNTLALADGTVTAAFYASTLNRAIGCAAPGTALLVENNPRTIFGSACYEWALTVGSTRDERNAKRLSDKVEATLREFDPAKIITMDDERQREYYIICGDQALVHNYGCDAWYLYTNLPVASAVCIDGNVYFGTPDGRIMHFSRQHRNDNLEPIDAYWESGSMDFAQDWRRKYSAVIWVGIKPESQGRVTVTAQSNRKSEYLKKDISAGLATFTNVNFAHWSFGTNRKPQVRRVRIKVKKFTFYKLIFSSCSTSSTATILTTDFRVRYTGNVK